MSKTIASLAGDLGWSLWTELGVPGVVRNHTHVAIDPEPLIVFSPWLFKDDARLCEEVVRWCSAHADRISASRLQGLLKAAPADVTAAFSALATTLRAHGVRWTDSIAAGADLPPSRAIGPSKPLPMALPTTRPALIRFRLRALAGVGARADVLAELLGHEGAWLIASDMQALGYSKRNVARILAELADAGLVQHRTERNAIAYQAHGPHIWPQLLRGEGLAWPDWATIFGLVGDVLRLDVESGKSESVRRVAATKAAQRFEAASDVLGWERPVSTTGNPDAWQFVIKWAEEQVGGLARGTSTAMAQSLWLPASAVEKIAELVASPPKAGARLLEASKRHPRSVKG